MYQLLQAVKAKQKRENDFLTLKEAAEIIKVSTTTIRDYTLRDVNPLPHYKIGKVIRLNRKDFLTWLKQEAYHGALQA